MNLRPLLLVPFLMLSGCASTPPPVVPAQIQPPPVLLMTACPLPDDLPDMATARELAVTLVEWIQAAACERGKRAGLLASWPH